MYYRECQVPMAISAFLKRLVSALAWVDRWVIRAGQSCCAGRAQAALDHSLSRQSGAHDPVEPD